MYLLTLKVWNSNKNIPLQPGVKKGHNSYIFEPAQIQPTKPGVGNYSRPRATFWSKGLGQS